MSESERELLDLLRQRSFKRGTFRLASGDTSSYYIDGRLTAVHSHGAHIIGEVIYEHTKDLGIDAIGGLAVGAVPLTTAAVISYHLHGRTLEGFWVRDQAKDHGTRRLVEGNLPKGSRVVLVEDVVTKGTSLLKAYQEVKGVDCDVVLVLALVDRLSGAERLFRDNGIKAYRSVFTIRDLGVTEEPAG
jgi:orotate phosphoribosyltransferase